MEPGYNNYMPVKLCGKYFRNPLCNDLVLVSHKIIYRRGGTALPGVGKARAGECHCYGSNMGGITSRKNNQKIRTKEEHLSFNPVRQSPLDRKSVV